MSCSALRQKLAPPGPFASSEQARQRDRIKGLKCRPNPLLLGLLDKLPVQVAAAGSAAVFRSLVGLLGYDLPPIRSKKLFSAESFGHRHSFFSGSGPSGGIPGCPEHETRPPLDDRKDREMKKLAFVLVSLLASTAAGAQTPKYPPLSEFMMPQEAEIALARSAAPDNVSSRATIKIFTTSGFKVAVEGDNGFVCIVLRGWAAPTYGPAQFRDYVYVADLRAPICFDPVSARTMMPYYELRHKLGMEGKGPDEIARGIEAAYTKGELQRTDSASLAYMFSADMYLGPHLGHGLIYPHLMLFLPYYDNAMLGATSAVAAFPSCQTILELHSP
jgi:hypothetical protein